MKVIEDQKFTSTDTLTIAIYRQSTSNFSLKIVIFQNRKRERVWHELLSSIRDSMVKRDAIKLI